MPKWLRVSVALICIMMAGAPLVITPGIAESNGWTRPEGSIFGALVSIGLFAIVATVSAAITRRQAKLEVSTEVDRLASKYKEERSDTYALGLGSDERE